MSIALKSLLIGIALGLVAYFIFEALTVTPKTVNARYSLAIYKKASFENMDELKSRSISFLKKKIADLRYQSHFTSGLGDRIEVEVEDVKDTATLRGLVTKSTKIEFRELYSLNQISYAWDMIGPVERRLRPSPKMDTLKSGRERSLTNDRLINPASIFQDAYESGGSYGGAIVSIKSKDIQLANRIFRDSAIRAIMPPDLAFCYGLPIKSGTGNPEEERVFLYAIRSKKNATVLGNDRIVDARAGFDYNGMPNITFQFDNIGTRMWSKLTSQAKGGYIAFIVDQKVVSAPQVTSAIPNGNVTLSGQFTEAETKELATQLRSGPPPARMTLISEELITKKPSMDHQLMLAGAIFVIGSLISFIIFRSLKGN